MAHLLIVGDSNCSFNSVAIAIGKCPTHAEVLDKWKELAKHLKTDEVKKLELQKSLNLETTKLSDVPEQLISDWRSRMSNEATLEKLCEAFNAAGLNTTAKYLIDQFVTSKNVDSGKTNEVISPQDGAVDSRSVKKEDDTPITEEGRKLKEYIQYYIIDLIEITDLSDDLVKAMTERGVLETKDLENINRSRLLEDKVKRFYQIILEKISKQPDVYEVILTVFMEDRSNRERGVADIFNRFFD